MRREGRRPRAFSAHVSTFSKFERSGDASALGWRNNVSMARNPSLDFLQRLLQGEIPTADEVKAIVRCREDQWIDYKSGLQLEEEAGKGAATLRRYASGFANAEGGTLVVGYHQKASKFDGANGRGSASLADWAANAVSSLISLPQPRFAVVRVDGVDVLLLAVARTPVLIPCIEKGQHVYWLRIGHELKEIPPFLVSDLMLGRRAHAVLRARVAHAGFAPSNGSSGYFDLPLQEIGLSLRVENTSLAHVEDIRAGLV